MRKDVAQAINDLRQTVASHFSHHNDLDHRFMDHVHNQGNQDRVLIEFNPISSMYQWTIKPAIRHRRYPTGSYDETQSYAEGRSASYQEALDAVLYHESLHRLGLPTKPNGTTKNY